jgi:hypothetical protein
MSPQARVDRADPERPSRFRFESLQDLCVALGAAAPSLGTARRPRSVLTAPCNLQRLRLPPPRLRQPIVANPSRFRFESLQDLCVALGAAAPSGGGEHDVLAANFARETCQFSQLPVTCSGCVYRRLACVSRLWRSLAREVRCQESRRRFHLRRRAPKAPERGSSRHERPSGSRRSCGPCNLQRLRLPPPRLRQPIVAKSRARSSLPGRRARTEGAGTGIQPP